jgi:stringent starvation protein B
MTSNRPYLIRAIYDWIVDNNMTPHLLVKADHEGVVVPTRYIKDGKIILNVAPQAVQGLTLGNDEVNFSARFSGVPQAVYLPTRAVLAIYARENGQGLVFNEEEGDATPPPTPTPGKKGAERPKLKVVK